MKKIILSTMAMLVMSGCASDKPKGVAIVPPTTPPTIDPEKPIDPSNPDKPTTPDKPVKPQPPVDVDTNADMVYVPMQYMFTQGQDTTKVMYVFKKACKDGIISYETPVEKNGVKYTGTYNYGVNERGEPSSIGYNFKTDDKKVDFRGTYINIQDNLFYLASGSGTTNIPFTVAIANRDKTEWTLRRNGAQGKIKINKENIILNDVDKTNLEIVKPTGVDNIKYISFIPEYIKMTSNNNYKVVITASSMNKKLKFNYHFYENNIDKGSVDVMMQAIAHCKQF